MHILLRWHLNIKGPPCLHLQSGSTYSPGITWWCQAINSHNADSKFRHSLVNIGSGDGLLPDGTKSLPEPKLTNHQWCLVTFTWREFIRKYAIYLSLIWVGHQIIQDYSHISQGSVSWILLSMMTSSNGNFFRVTGHLCGEFAGLRWIPRTKASDAELWCFLWSAHE